MFIHENHVGILKTRCDWSSANPWILSMIFLYLFGSLIELCLCRTTLKCDKLTLRSQKRQGPSGELCHWGYSSACHDIKSLRNWMIGFDAC